jgi:hypothetical protein
VLAPGTGGPVDVHLEIVRVDLDLDLLRLGQDGHGGGRGVDPPLRLGFRDPLHAVSSGLVLEDRIRAFALDGKGDLLEAADFGRRLREHLGPEATLLRVAGQHLKQVAREQRSFVAARACPDLDQDVLRVVRVLLHGRQANLLGELGEPVRTFGDELAKLGVVPVVGQELPGALQIVAEHRVFTRQRVSGLQLPVFASDLGIPLPIGDHRRVRHLPLQLREAGFDLFHEGFDHLPLSVTRATQEGGRRISP